MFWKRAVTRSNEYSESIINTVREPLIVLDQDLRVVTVSRSFYEFFKVKPEETVGQLIYDLGNKQWDIPKLRELLETILPQKTTFDNYEVEHNFASIGRRVMLLNARQIQRVLGKERIILLSIEDITERKKANDLLQTSEIQYRRLFEAAQDGILILDVDTGNVLDVNPFLINILGFSKQQIQEKSIWEMGFLKDAIGNKDKFLELQQNKYVRYENLPLETADGRQLDVEFVSNVYMVGDRRVIQCNIRDITERREIENGLEKTRKELAIIKKTADEVSEFAESIINTVREPLISLDQDLRVVTVSRSFYEFFKVKPEETVGQLIYDLGNKQWDIPKLRELLETILPQKTTFDNYEVEHNFASIGRRVMLLNARQIQRVLGKERIILLSIEDITERKQIERQLRFHAEVLDKISDVVVVIDNNNIVNYWNKGAERLYGLSEEEALGQPLEEVYQSLWVNPEDEQDSVQALETKGFWSGDNIHTKRDGVRLYVQSSVSMIKDGNGEVIGMLSVIRDVTGRTEVDLLKDEFIGLVSHEMRTPLTVIIGGLNTILGNGDLIPQNEVNELLNDALSEAESLAQILENLLELSRTQAKQLFLSPEPMRIDNLAKDVVKAFKGKSGHQFILDFPSEIPPVEADTLRVKRILYNLVQNAVKYSPAGSKIKVFARQKPDHVVIGVRDHGIGISTADQSRIFHAFQRLGLDQSGKIKGSGLGLMVCLRLVQAHGGKIWVESAPEKGSTFYFTLPLHPGSSV